eukprot:scaffold167699_cov21-Tisochrysis_lutea.AAC.3
MLSLSAHPRRTHLPSPSARPHRKGCSLVVQDHIKQRKKAKLERARQSKRHAGKASYVAAQVPASHLVAELMVTLALS